MRSCPTHQTTDRRDDQYAHRIDPEAGAEREAARHDLEALSVLSQLLHRIRDRAHLIAVVLEELPERGANALLVVGDEDLGAHFTTL